MKRKIVSAPPKPMRSREVPVSLGMLDQMEGRLSHKFDSGLSAVRGEMSAMNSELKSEMSSLKSEMFGMKSELHRVALLVEEQNARNKFVLDGYAQLYDLIERKLG